MKNFKEIRQKIGLTVAAGVIAFGGMSGAEKATAQDGGDNKRPDVPRAQLVPPESPDNSSNIAVIEDPGEVPPKPDELTDEERVERNEVFSMYPGGDERQFLSYIRENGWQTEWDMERKAYKVMTETEIYYFFPKMGIEGGKNTDQRAKEDLDDGLTVYGGNIESNFVPGVSGIRINVYVSRNFEMEGKPVGLRFREDLAGSQHNIDLLTNLLIEEFPEMWGKELSILLVADNFDIYGNSPEAIKEALELVGGYSYSAVGRSSKAGMDLIGNTYFIRVSINSNDPFYHHPDGIGNSTFVGALSPFASNGRLDANDLNTTEKRLANVLKTYYEITGLPSYTLVGTER
jgi:hypothetical protein